MRGRKRYVSASVGQDRLRTDLRVRRRKCCQMVVSKIRISMLGYAGNMEEVSVGWLFHEIAPMG